MLPLLAGISSNYEEGNVGAGGCGLRVGVWGNSDGAGQ